MRVHEAVEPAVPRSCFAGAAVPGAAVFVGVCEALQVAIGGAGGAAVLVPGAAALVQELQALQVPARRCSFGDCLIQRAEAV